MQTQTVSPPSLLRRAGVARSCSSARRRLRMPGPAEGAPDWNQHSKRHRGDFSICGQNVEALYRETASRWRRIDRGFVAELFHKLVSVTTELIASEGPESTQTSALFDFNPENRSRSATLLRVSQILSSFFGATLVIVGTPPPGEQRGAGA
jgi:hypothetical protein